ncbi:hypothetical protein [Leptospira adleri]|uniref:hypothetical protein n=1 Tax=Leptospira adleri TaxID=2023186 RepID=UPI0010836160|nr:hypothetical protein [Leptospira adleri]TGM58553.1 hypothetical protein EHQ97_05500 [Leptospira adleri]
MNINQIKRRLEILSTALLNSRLDDARNSLEEIYNFILENSILLNYVIDNRDREYSEEELFVERDWSRYKIPGNTKGRIGFTWSLIEFFLKDQDMEYWNLADHYGNESGGSKDVNRHIRPFNEAVIMPFLQLLESHLIDQLSSADSSTGSSVSIGYLAGNLQIAQNSQNITQSIDNSDIFQLFSNVLKEINSSSFSAKEELAGLIEVYLGDIERINTKHTNYLQMVLNKLKDFNAIVTGSTFAYRGIQYLEQLLNMQ